MNDANTTRVEYDCNYDPDDHRLTLVHVRAVNGTLCGKRPSMFHRGEAIAKSLGFMRTVSQQVQCAKCVARLRFPITDQRAGR